MSQFKTLKFPNTPRGQAEKIAALEYETRAGWRVVSEVIIPGHFKGGDACCLFIIFPPCAFLAGRTDDIITITLERGDVNEGEDVQTRLEYDRKRWAALLQYDPQVASYANEITPLGTKWIDEFASAYLTLNDPKYLPEIAARVREKAIAEQAAEEEWLRQEQLLAEQAAQREAARKADADRRRQEFYGRIRTMLFGGPINIALTIVVFAATLALLAYGLHKLAGMHTSTVAPEVSPSATPSDSPSDTAADSKVAPSFNCEHVTSDVLKLVCDTPQLSQDDVNLAQAYGTALRTAADPQKLKADERNWISQRNNSPSDVQALHKLYQDRIAALDSGALSEPDPAASSAAPSDPKAAALLTPAASIPAPSVSAVSTTNSDAEPAGGIDCNASPTGIAQMVCLDGSLRRQDAQVSAIFKTLLERAGPDERVQFASEQRDWVSQRNQCTSVACLIASYRSRYARVNSRHGPNIGKTILPSDHSRWARTAPFMPPVCNPHPLPHCRWRRPARANGEVQAYHP